MTHTLLCVPTEAEAAPLRGLPLPGTRLVVTGVGPAATAEAVVRAVVRHRPCRLLLAGIAGVYPEAGAAVGETVAVREERTAGLPPRFADRWEATWLPGRLRGVVSNTVCTCGASPAGAQIENMEGSAFFATARAFGLPAAEVRALSNRVGEPFAEWRTAEALAALAQTLSELLNPHAHE